jgi:hypothetical protein
MNRRISALSISAMLAGASLLSAVPALAQTNSDGYTVYTQNYDGTVQTPTGTSGGPGKATVAAGSSVTIKAPGGANYDDASQSAAATVTVAGTTQTVGTTTFTNVADSGTQAENLTWQYTPTTTGPGLERYTTSGSINQRPIVDLADTVSFNIYVASSSPNATVNMTLEIEENSTYYYNADVAADTFAPIPTTVSGQQDILGMRGSDNTAETDIWAVGGAGNTTSGGFPADGKPLLSGQWQTVTFTLPTDPHFDILDTGGTTGYRTSGLGSIYGMDFVPVNPATGQAYSIYIDDLTIGTVAAAPEPSEWAAMGVGAAALLGLALRARRRGAGVPAA